MPVSTRSSKYDKNQVRIHSSTSESKDEAPSFSPLSKKKIKSLNSDQMNTLQRKHIANTITSSPTCLGKKTPITSVAICYSSSSKAHVPPPLSSTRLTALSHSIASKTDSITLSTDVLLPSTRYEQILLPDYSDYNDKTHHLINRSSSSLSLSRISPSESSEKESYSNISTDSFMMTPTANLTGPLLLTLINTDMNRTFDKRLSDQYSMSPPSTSSPLSPKVLISPLSLRSSYVLPLSANNSLPSYDQALPPRMNNSTNDDLDITEDDEEVRSSFMSDSQYEMYLSGEIKFGESTKNKPMVFMKNYCYLYMSTAPTLGTDGYRCVRRDLNCPTTIHIHTTSNQYHRWNGKRHIHPPDVTEQRRREIISIIKKRVVIEHRPVCSIVEEEYAKAKLTKEEQVIFKNPKQLG